MKKFISKTALSLLFLVTTTSVQAQCHSFLTVENNTDENFTIQSTRDYNNVERFIPILIPANSRPTTSWFSNNGFFDSTNYWVNISFLDKEKQEVLKMSADATDKKENSVHICRPDNFWIVSGYLCKQYHCTTSIISDGKERADFFLSINKK